MIKAKRILQLHDDWNAVGHGGTAQGAAVGSPFEAMVVSQHQANFDLWHEEDRARDPLAPDAEIARVKHSIDDLNQRRNDLMEQIDAVLVAEQEQNEMSALHSETPGLIIDRLSILSLKLFHSLEESERGDANESHRQRNRERALVLRTQRDDLAGALDELWGDIVMGRRRFRLYKQLKMYNDPTLNPVLYRRTAAKQS